MYCPFCETTETKVIDSRLISEGVEVRRRRECADCGERFTTFEKAELLMPRIIKRDGERVPFDEVKLRAGLERALEKRPVDCDKVETMMAHLVRSVRAEGEREVSALKLGEFVMHELRQVDQVAYVRFASVYRRFKDVSEFSEEVKSIKKEKVDG